MRAPFFVRDVSYAKEQRVEAEYTYEKAEKLLKLAENHLRLAELWCKGK